MKKVSDMRVVAAGLGAAALMLLALACGGGGSGGVADDATLVSLTPSDIDAKPGEAITVDVEVDPKGRGISAAEVTIAFDPQVLAYQGISWGGLLGQSPVVGVELGDNEAGRLIFALARRGPTTAPTGVGTLATLTFRVLDGAVPGEHELAINWVGLADEAQRDVTPIATNSTSVNL